MKIEEMSKHHNYVWTVLQTMEDGERIIGPALMERTGIKDRRGLYQIINGLRQQGHLVGSSKHPDDRGYYEIRDEIDLRRTLASLRNAAVSLLDTAESIERTFNNRKYGTLLPEDEEGEDGE